MRWLTIEKVVLTTCLALLASIFLAFVTHAAGPPVTAIPSGGTATSTLPSYGNVLVGGKNGEYEFAATSTFAAAAAPVQSVFSRTGAITAQSGDYTTSLVTEGSNLYYTLARWATAFAGTTTNALNEGSNNLYFTNARSDARFITDLAATTSVKSITTLSSLSLPYSQLTGAPTALSAFTNDSGFVTSSFSTTSATYFSSLGLAFSTTSANYWFTQQAAAPSFSTTSAAYFASIGLAFSTTSANYNFTTNLTATTSVKSITTLPSLSLPYSQLSGTPTAAFPVTLSAGVFGFGGLTTSTAAVQGNVPYFSGPNSFANAATGTVTCSGTASCGAGSYVLGNNLTITGSAGTSASTTLLGDTNTFSGTDKFNNAITVGSLSGLIGGNNGILYAFASSSLFGYTPLNPTRQLTISGTANQLTSSAGAQDLSVDRTWTLSLPNHVIFPVDFVVTNSTTTNATTTGSVYLTGLTGSGGELGIDGNNRVYKAATTTAGTGLSYSAGAFNVTGLTTSQFSSANISQWTNDALYTSSSFSTTSANYWSTLGLGFSTTSTDYWKTQRSFFASTSADFWLAATTSVKSITTLPSLSLPYSQLTGTPTVVTSVGASGVVSSSGGTTPSLTITGGSPGQVLGWLSGVPTWTASSSVAAGTGISISPAGSITTITNTGVTSIVAGTNITISGATGAVTINCPSCGGTGSSGNWFTPSSNFGIASNATSTQIDFGVGFTASSTSHIASTSIDALVSTTNAFGVSFDFSALTANRTYTLPNKAGTLVTLNGTQTFSGIDTFTNAPIFSSLTGLLKGNGASALAVAAYTDFPTMTANTLLANGTAATAAPTAISTSTLYGAGTPGTDLVYTSAGLALVATSTFNAPLSFANNAVSLSTAGTWSGLAGTATALAANGTNCTAGNAPLGVDASGNAEGCFGVAAFSYPFSLLGLGTTSPIMLLASTTIGNGTATAGLTVSGTASTTNFINTSMTSALALFDANHKETAYGGASACTNQFVTALSAVGASTCASINNAQWSGAQLTVGNGGTGQTTFTAGNLLYGNGGAALSSVATSSTATISTIMALDAIGHGAFIYATTTEISAASGAFFINSSGGISSKDVATGFTGITSPVVSLSLQTGTTTGWIATTSNPYIPQSVAPFAGTLKDIKCATDASFLGVEIDINGSPITPKYFVASTTKGLISATAGNTFVAGDTISFKAGTTTTATATTIFCTVRTVQTS